MSSQKPEAWAAVVTPVKQLGVRRQAEVNPRSSQTMREWLGSLSRRLPILWKPKARMAPGSL